MVRRLFFFTFLVAALLTACSDNDSFSVSSGNRLSFQKDTIRFDTLFSTVPSSTRTLWIHNESSDGIRIQTARLERGTSWIKLCIAIAPSLGFLGTVIGMVMAFDQIQTEGDIGPTIVAEGMKVALLTTIFGIVVALILQVFYNFVNSRIDRLTIQMEEGAITLLDIISKSKRVKE